MRIFSRFTDLSGFLDLAANVNSLKSAFTSIFLYIFSAVFVKSCSHPCMIGLPKNDVEPKKIYIFLIHQFYYMFCWLGSNKIISVGK